MDSPPPFDVDVRRDGGSLVVAPAGELDLATTDLVRAELPPLEDVERVVLDLRAVEFLDTTGMRFVLDLHERARTGGLGIHIVRGGAPVQRIFEIAGLEAGLPFVDEPPA